MMVHLPAWVRVISYLLLAVMILEVSTMTTRLQKALMVTGTLFILYAMSACALALGQVHIRDFILDYVQTPYMVIAIGVWMVTFWKIGRSFKPPL